MSSRGYVHGFQIDERHSLHIYQGSLVEVQADALVSSDDNHLTAAGGVARALAEAAGTNVREERLQLVAASRPGLGEVVRTAAGGLPCRFLYHGITIDFDRDEYMDGPTLRRLVSNVLTQATDDGVKTLGLPALGTGTANFDLATAAEIMIDELLTRLIHTPVERVVLALIGDEALRLFYEKLVRSQAERLASLSLRQRDAEAAAGGEIAAVPGRSASCEMAVVEAGCPKAAEGETIEQFPCLVDECRLAVATPSQPKLVDGLADLILQFADPQELEEELLSLPACRGFRGTIKQRLMEFLYLSEDNLRTALGPTLFKNRDLKKMLTRLGQDVELARDHEQVVSQILQALCFNLVSPPTGMVDYIRRLKRLLADVRRHDADEQVVKMAAMEAGKLLEVTLKDLLRMYGFLFWGPDCETELVAQRIVPARRNGTSPLVKLTIGEARQGLEQLQALSRRERAQAAKVAALQRSSGDFLPQRINVDSIGPAVESHSILQAIIELRNAAAHDGDEWPRLRRRDDVVRKLDSLHAFFCACQEHEAYPVVLRYEGTFENRNGERFVYFVDEDEKKRHVRTDERIDPRRHYYCFATNNPVHLHPTLIPKL